MPLEQAFLHRLYRQIGEIFSQIAPEDQITFLNEVKGIVENPGGFHFFRLVASKKIWLLIYPLSRSYANLSNPDREELSSLLAQRILTSSYNLERQIAQSSSIEAKEAKTSQLEIKCLAIAKDILMIKTMLRDAANTAVTIIPETFTSRGHPLSLVTPFDHIDSGIDIKILLLIYLLWEYKIRTLSSCSGHDDVVAHIQFDSLSDFTNFIDI
ncbi:MAG: hypothetical protein M1561_05315, partial [Gammaproteobacteria bacterium]|nr:hypothetical protein [Gammaproteobacteria bacterium]